MSKTTPDKPLQSAIPPSAVDEIVRLMCNAQEPGAIIAVCQDRLKLSGTQAHEAIEAARARIVAAAAVQRPEETGKALRRIEHLYQVANSQIKCPNPECGHVVKLRDVPAALACQKELNRMLGLYDGGVDEGREGQDKGPEAKGEERTKTDSEEVFDAIEKYIEPLKLTDDPAATYAELVRLAARRIVERNSKKKRRKKKGAKDGRAKEKK